MPHVIDKLNAVSETTVQAANNGRPITIPVNLDPRELVATLSKLGLVIPTAVAAGVAKNDLRDSGHKFTVKETDAVLAKADLSITDRIAIKNVMDRNGILAR